MSEKYFIEGELYNTFENNEYLSSIEGIEKAMYEGKILEGIAVKAQGTQSLTIELGEVNGIRLYGIMEKSEVQYTDKEDVKDIALITRVGKPICFKVTKVLRKKTGAPEIILSRREAQLDYIKNHLCSLIPGDIIPAKVTHLEPFGAFVDIGCGIISLLTIDSMSVSRISHPSDRLSIGTRINVVIRSFSKNSEGIVTRVFVSRRELLGTWEENASLFSVGQTVTGIVRSVEPYGIFVELTPNLAGLAEYKEGVSVGQSAAVYIKSIIPDRMKIKLVIIDSYRAICTQKQYQNDFCPDDSHMSYWRYSPLQCDKVVETVF